MTLPRFVPPTRAGVALLLTGLLAGCASERVAAPGTARDRGDAVLEAAGPDAATAPGIGNGPTSLERVDRMGMPAIATAVITSKDAYNKADPTDDAAGTFVPEIVASVTALHAALDDDLAGLGLTACAPDECVAQAAPFVVPDVIRIDPTKPSGFPNGRRLTDPVIDVTLALVLLDLDRHEVTTLIGVNPTENDRRFRSTFPYLAPPHGAVGSDGEGDDLVRGAGRGVR